MNHRSGVVLTALILVAGAPPPLAARSVTAENRAELANVPPSWKNPRVCFQEGGGVGGPRVVIGGEVGGVGVQSFAIRPQTPGARLPGYLMNTAAELFDTQVRVEPAPGVGYADGDHEIFVMPSGVRLTCESLPTEDAAPRR